MNWQHTDRLGKLEHIDKEHIGSSEVGYDLPEIRFQVKTFLEARSRLFWIQVKSLLQYIRILFFLHLVKSQSCGLRSQV
jgi:hypothetical protein